MAEMLLNELISVYEGMGVYGNFSYPPTHISDGMPENIGGIWGDGWCGVSDHSVCYNIIV